MLRWGRTIEYGKEPGLMETACAEAAFPRTHGSRQASEFPVPVPTGCRDAGNGNWEVDAASVFRIDCRARRSGVGEVITIIGFADAAGIGQCGDSLVKRGGADAAKAAQLGERQRPAGIRECGDNALVDRTRRR